MSSDFIVIGGGLVGAAVSYGLRRTGASVIMLDEGDTAFRASRGNFGLVWVQSKGCLLYTSPSPRDRNVSRMPSSA